MAHGIYLTHMWEWMVVREGFLEKGASLDLGSVLITLPTVWMMNCWRESLEALKVIHIWGHYDGMQRKQWVCSGDWIPADWFLLVIEEKEGVRLTVNWLDGSYHSLKQNEEQVQDQGMMNSALNTYRLKCLWNIQELILCLCESLAQDKEPGRLQSMGLQGVRHDWKSDTFTFLLRREPHELQGACGSGYDNPEST